MNRRGRILLFWALASLATQAAPLPSPPPNFAGLRMAIEDLIKTHGADYPRGEEYLRRLAILESMPADPARFRELQREALLANPLLDLDRVLVVKRRPRPLPGSKVLWSTKGATPIAGNGLDLALPSNHECNSSLPPTGWDNEIAWFSPRRPETPLTPLYRPPNQGYAGEMDLHWDATRLLFTQSQEQQWSIWEMKVDGTEARPLSKFPADVDAFDACYLPNGQIVFGSTATFQSVPCWHGLKRVSNLYLMNGDGSGVRQVCFDQDHNLHPVVLPNGQVLYHRWDYTGINHIFLRQLMVMNPDGTGQRAVYGANSWYPNALYFPRPLPGDANRLVAILSGYHGAHRMGQLVVLDTAKGWHEAKGIVTRISGQGDPIKPMIRDNLVDEDWPKFLHPFPLSDKHFLVACLPRPQAAWGIYLADIFDNLVLLREEPAVALLEPVPVRPRPAPPVIPDRIQPGRQDAVVYLHNVYAGPGLAGVPRGTIKSLRVFAYHFGYVGMAGPDRIGRGGPWEVMRILGTVPTDEDGSAIFRVPANTPLAVQPLDAEGKAVQLMRSWFTAMPGEVVSCVGCHEPPNETPTRLPALAARQTPRDLIPWHGPPRGFDFAREVQPVLDRHCVSCHDGRADAQPDLRPEEALPHYRGQPLSELARKRLHPAEKSATGGLVKYTPAYEALLPYLRRVGIEDDVSLLLPADTHADTSPLIQLLRKGHQGVQLTAEDWDRLVTWIDLNAPCHGTWGEVFPIPDGAHQRRLESFRQFGGPAEDPELVPSLPPPKRDPVPPRPLPKFPPAQAARWPMDHAQARQRQADAGPQEWVVDLGGGISLKMVRVPAGEFVMGDAAGEPDEGPPCSVTIGEAFWMAAGEISNEQYRRFDSSHESRYYGRRHAASDDQGLPLDGPRQPVVRVSWQEAMAFCRWLSEKTGCPFSLPTEAQWEWACRAGSAAPFSWGGLADDYSGHANLADRSFRFGLDEKEHQTTGGLAQLMLEGAFLGDSRFNDRMVVTAPTGGYAPNAWGLHDLHGNAAEWTRSLYQPYPYREDDGRNDVAAAGRRVVRGGSFFDPPRRSRSSYRLDYPAWQKVFNVGFRVVGEKSAREVAGAAGKK